MPSRDTYDMLIPDSGTCFTQDLRRQRGQIRLRYNFKHNKIQCIRRQRGQTSNGSNTTSHLVDVRRLNHAAECTQVAVQCTKLSTGGGVPAKEVTSGPQERVSAGKRTRSDLA